MKRFCYSIGFIIFLLWFLPGISIGQEVTDINDYGLGLDANIDQPFGVLLIDNLKILSYDGEKIGSLVETPIVMDGGVMGIYQIYKIKAGKHKLSVQFIQVTYTNGGSFWEGLEPKLNIEYSTNVQDAEIQIDNGKYYVLEGEKYRNKFSESKSPVIYRTSGDYAISFKTNKNNAGFDYIRGQKLLRAVKQGDINNVQMELNNNRDLVKTRWTTQNYSLLHLAACANSNRTGLIEYFLSQGLSPNEKAGKDQDIFPIHAAVFQKADGQTLNAVGTLLKHYALVNARRISGETPLYYVCCNSKRILNPSESEIMLSVVRFLIEHGANANLSDQDGYSPLYWAVNANDLNLIKLLLAGGANVNILNSKGETPLHEATRRGLTEAARILIEQNAQINARNNEGSTPLHLAVQAAVNSGSQRKVSAIENIIELLIAHKALLNEKDNNGRTPLSYISSGSIYELLKKNGGN